MDMLRKMLPVFVLLTLASCERPQDDTVLTPCLKITGTDPAVVSAEGGELTIGYELTDGDGGEISARSTADWIEYLSSDTESSQVYFNVMENLSAGQRTAEIVVEYAFETGKTADTVAVLQEGTPEHFDHVFEAEYFTGEYFGQQYGNGGETNYFVTLADAPGTGQNLSPGGTYYLLDIFSTEPSEMSAIMIPEGTYTCGMPGETASMTFTPDYSYWMKVDGSGTGYEVRTTFFTEGSVDISYEDGSCRIDARLVDENGKTHRLSYGGEALCSNGLVESSLTGDIEVDCEGMAVEAIFYGDYYMNLTTDWYIVMASAGGEVLQLDICSAEGGKMSDGLPTGTFTASTSEYGANEGEFVPGYIEGSYQSCWYYNENAQGHITDPLAPLMSGEITISENADGTHTISIDCSDDASPAHRITAEWTGVPSYSDESFAFSTDEAVDNAVGKTYHRNIYIVR